MALKDVVTLEEAPRMGCGVMELDHTSFEWTLTYDEYDIVLEGTLEIEIDGRIVSGARAISSTSRREAIFISRQRTNAATFTPYIRLTGQNSRTIP